jgi:hypothetical protein
MKFILPESFVFFLKIDWMVLGLPDSFRPSRSVGSLWSPDAECNSACPQEDPALTVLS